MQTYSVIARCALGSDMTGDTSRSNALLVAIATARAQGPVWRTLNTDCVQVVVYLPFVEGVGSVSVTS